MTRHAGEATLLDAPQQTVPNRRPKLTGAHPAPRGQMAPAARRPLSRGRSAEGTYLHAMATLGTHGHFGHRRCRPGNFADSPGECGKGTSRLPSPGRPTDRPGGRGRGDARKPGYPGAWVYRWRGGLIDGERRLAPWAERNSGQNSRRPPGHRTGPRRGWKTCAAHTWSWSGQSRLTSPRPSPAASTSRQGWRTGCRASGRRPSAAASSTARSNGRNKHVIRATISGTNKQPGGSPMTYGE